MTQTATAILTFNVGDEREYQRVVIRRDGYVLTERPENKERFMLHLAECPHLGAPTKGELRFSSTRRWAQVPRPLTEWAETQTGLKPLKCQTCWS